MKVLVMRTVGKSLKSYNGFTYPEKGLVKCPDWKPSQQCGNGLHGLLWGHGSFNIPTDNVLFQLIEVEDAPDNLIEFDGKCKFREGEVVFTGEQAEAIRFIKQHPNYPKDNILNFDIQITTDSNKIMQSGYESTQTAGYKSTQTAGDGSTQKAGDGSTQKAGDGSTQKAGDGSTQKAGDGSTQKAGDGSTQKAGDGSTQKAGYESTQTAGDGSTQKAGDGSTQTAGYKSTQKAGYKSTQTAGDGSTQKAGDGSTQTAGYESTQKAGNWSTQKAGDGSTQTAGDESTQTAGDGSTQKAGVNSIQIGYWYDDDINYRVVSRIVTKDMADKPYKFETGKWTLVK